MQTVTADARTSARAATSDTVISDKTQRRTITLLVALIALAAGVAAAAAEAAPTGHQVTDMLLAGVGVGLITLLGSRAPRWALVATGGLAAAIAADPILIAIAALAMLNPLLTLRLRANRPALLAVSTGLTFNVVIRAEHYGFLGFTAIVGALCATVIFVAGLRRCSRRVRRLAWICVAFVGFFVIAAAAGIGYAVLSARHALTDGLRSAELGVAALEHDNFDEAAVWFEQAAEDLVDAAEKLNQPWARPAAAVPVLAQHRHAVVDMSTVGASGASTVADALTQIDPDDLRVEDGRIDLVALAAIESPLQRVRDALADLQAATDGARSPWLVDRATYELKDFDESIAEHVPSLDSAIAAVRIAPDLLGADGPRRYLLLFTTPSESRGLGGLIGSYAELTADDGVLTLSHAGQAADLDVAAQEAGAHVDGPAEFLDRYGRFGYHGDDGRVGNAAFRDLAMTPHFPWVGEIAASLYTKTTGRTVDGVIAADPFVIADLLRYTGPIVLPSSGQQLSADNALAFLLHDQYVVSADDAETPQESLGEAASVSLEEALDEGLPDPIQLALDLGPLVEQRRLLFWSKHEVEQDLLASLEIDGAIPELDGTDGWAFTVSNAVGSKIDTYLERRAHYESVDEHGVTRATLRIELTNTAPAEGLPARLIGGGQFGLPPGTMRFYLSVYSALDPDSFVVDGESVAVDADVERGWNVHSTFAEIPSGETLTIEVDLSGVVEHAETVVTWTQPMARTLETVGSAA